MVNIRSFQLSCKVFWGYRISVDLDLLDTTEEIVPYVKNSLDNYLRKVNLICLAEDLAKMEFNSPSLESMLLSNSPNNIVYICNHKHGDSASTGEHSCGNSTKCNC